MLFDSCPNLVRGYLSSRLCKRANCQKTSAKQSRAEPSLAFVGLLVEASRPLPGQIQKHWIWWNLAEPVEQGRKISELIETEPSGIDWRTEAQTKKLVAMMSSVNKDKLREAQASGQLTIGTVYKRTRPDANGRKMQRAEVRFDERYRDASARPSAGSSRQIVLMVKGKSVRSRLLARGSCSIDGMRKFLRFQNSNDAYHLFGDGLVVPVVDWLGKHLLSRIALANKIDEVGARVT